MMAENAEKLREMSATMNPDLLARMAAAMQVVVDGTEKDLRREAARVQPPSERQRLEAQRAAALAQKLPQSLQKRCSERQHCAQALHGKSPLKI